MHYSNVQDTTQETPVSHHSPYTRLLALPCELILKIITHLSLQDLNCLAQTCRLSLDLLQPTLYRRDSQRRHGNVAILWGAEFGSISTVRTALKHGADVNAHASSPILRTRPGGWHKRKKPGGSLVNLSPGIDDKDALTLAAEKGHADIVELVLKQPGIDLDCAIRNGQTMAVEVLLASDGIDFNGDMYCKTRMFLLAALWGRVEIVRLFLGCQDVEVGATDQCGFTALHLAAMHGHAATIEELRKHNGTDVYALDLDGCMALHWAAKSGRMSSVRALLSSHVGQRKPSRRDGSICSDVSLGPVRRV